MENNVNTAEASTVAETSLNLETVHETVMAARPTENRDLAPQWVKGQNLGEYKPLMIFPTIENFIIIARLFPVAVLEFLMGALLIKCAGPTITARIMATLVAKYGKPERKETEAWKKKHYEEARSLAAQYCAEPLDIHQAFFNWCSDWKATPAAQVESKVSKLSDAEKRALLAKLQAELGA